MTDPHQQGMELYRKKYKAMSRKTTTPEEEAQKQKEVADLQFQLDELARITKGEPIIKPIEETDKTIKKALEKFDAQQVEEI